VRENRFVSPALAGSVSTQIGAASTAAVLPLQLIQQLPQMGRQLGILRANVLPQPFADATAYRSAGGAIDLFAALVHSVHRGFRFALFAGDCRGIKSSAAELFRLLIDCMAFAQKMNEAGNRFQVALNRATSRGRARPGLVEAGTAVPISSSG
jgi:hypothetical protein